MVSVTVTFDEPGTTPPVYVAGSFTDWTPFELDFTTYDEDDSTKFKFHKSLNVSTGDHQYKFRLGAGDWWICDSTKPMGDDGSGNTNNILTVHEPNKSLNGHAKTESDVNTATNLNGAEPTTVEDTSILSKKDSNIKNYIAMTEKSKTNASQQPEVSPETQKLGTTDKPSEGTKTVSESASLSASQPVAQAKEVISKLPAISDLPVAQFPSIVADKVQEVLPIDKASKVLGDSVPASVRAETSEQTSWLSRNKTTVAIVIFIPIVISWFIRR